MTTVEQVRDIIVERAGEKKRYIVAVAGAPGAGKSTLAQELVKALPDGEGVVVPMDGFHYDNAVLDQLGLRDRKGAPETFDFGGFAKLLERIHKGEDGVAIPLFDREADLARAGAALVNSAAKFIIVEGNYLLLDEDPWPRLAEYFDLTVLLNVPREELRRRLMQRWLELGDSEERAEHWVTTNDMPNVDRVLKHSRSADLSVPS